VTINNNGIFDLQLNGTASIKSLAGDSTAKVLLGFPPNTLAITNASGTFGGVISGNGAVTIAGGTQTLTGANTYNGATTINNGATLQAGAANTFSSTSAVTVDSGGTLALNNFSQAIGSLAGAGNVTLGSGVLTTNGNNTSTIHSGVISGSGGLTKTGTGTLTLSGVNTYGGTTSLQSGTLAIAGSGSIANSVVQFSSGAVLDISGVTTGSTTIGGLQASFNPPVSVLLGANTLNIGNVNGLNFFSGNISGTGGVTLMGGGPTAFGNVNDYTGETTITNGTRFILSIQFPNKGSIAASSGVTINNNGIFDLQLNGTASIKSLAGDSTGQVLLGFPPNALVITNASGTFGGVISGSGAVTIAGGTETLTGANAYTGATTINNGATLQAGAANTFSSASAVTVDSGGTLALNSFSQTIGSLAGAGNVTLGSGVLTTNGNNDSTIFSGVISGTGGLTKTGTGTLILAADNSYIGITTVSGGALQLGNGGATGSIIGNVLNNGVFAINRSNTYSFDSVISGSGAFQQNGSGTTILTATSTYTGATTVNAGTLLVNGSIATSNGLTVNAGTVGGIGTLPSTTINGGALSPGNSIGTIAVAGNLMLTGASNYIVEVSPTTADRTNATGTASLAGTVTLLPQAGTYTVGKQYVILNATGGVNGAFGTTAVTGTFGAGIRPRVSYDSNNAFLNLDPTGISPFLPGGLTQNQRAVAAALDAGFAAGTPPAAFLALFNLPAASLPGALTQLSGEIGTGAFEAVFRSTDQFLNMMLDPFLETQLVDGTPQGRAFGFAAESPQTALPEAMLAYARMPTKAPVGAAPLDPRWAVWSTGFGASANLKGDAVIGSSNLSVRNAGVAGGFDYKVTPATTLGMAMAGSWSSYGISTGSGNADTVQFGLYGSHRWQQAYVMAAVAFGWHEMTTDRTVSLPGITDRLRGEFHAGNIGGRLEAGYRYATPIGFGLTPYAAVQAQGARTSAYGERDLSGLAAFGLNYAGRNTDDVRSELGARVDHRVRLDNAQLILRGRAAWTHDYSTDRSIAALFQTMPVAGFTVIGASPATDALLVSGGGELRFAGGWSVRAKFDGEFSNRTQSYGGSGGVRVAW
jgi:autotransporter-associated beta strand protein